MTEYLVRWEINIDAETAEEAARKALEIQRRRDSEAVCFEVQTMAPAGSFTVILGEVERIDLLGEARA